MNDEKTPKEKEVKRRFQSWLRPSTIKLMDRLYEDDNCKSKSEFIEKAVRFYAGYLSTQNAREYLPNVVISTLKSIIAESDNRQNRMMFKLAVEIAIMQNLVALQQDIDPLSLERLRGDCVKEVKNIFTSLTSKKSRRVRPISASCFARRVKSSNDPARNMNGRTDRRRSPFGETFGFISTISRAATPLTSSEGSITRTIPRQ